MKLLFDTHILLWAAVDSVKLPKKAKALLEDYQNELFFSAASIWEVAIKYSLAKAEFNVHPQLLRSGLLDNGYSELAITGKHSLGISDLPDIHKDPFDRLLVAQSLSEGISLVTSDETVMAYRGLVVGV